MPTCYITLTGYPINLDAMCEEERGLVERMLEAYRQYPVKWLGADVPKSKPNHPVTRWATKRWNPLREAIWAFLDSRGHPFAGRIPKYTSVMIQTGRWKSTRRNPYFAHDIHFDLSYRVADASASFETRLPRLPIEQGAW